MSCAVFYSPQFTHHVTPQGHPECPQRVEVIAKALKSQSLPLIWREPKKADIQTLLTCHSPQYVALVQKEVEAIQNPPRLAYLSTGDVVISPESLDVALLAVGAATDAVDAVMQGDITSAFAIVRPPGHHATRNCGMGFCLFNNVAIAARYAQKKYGIKRVAILDWDLHHGNGTEDICTGDNSLFYFSTHQAGIYPGTGLTSSDTIVNCPIAPGDGSKDAILHAFRHILPHYLEKLAPQLFFISCGFDAHCKDPLGALNLTESDYYELTTIVKGYAKKWADARVVSVLEGGYNLDVLGPSAISHVQALLQ